MMGVLAIALVFWGVGHLTGAPQGLRWGMIALLYVAVLIALSVAPDSFEPMLGGSIGSWLVLGAVAFLGWGYAFWLNRMRKRARPVSAEESKLFSATELERYARHIILREIGGPGQKALKEARVLVIGAGGLGAPALQYLAAAGVGTIGVIDHDEVDNSNLQRQVIHKDKAIGIPKVFSARDEMLAQNPNIVVKPYHRRLDADIAAELFAEYDLILDGTDNFATRYLVNSAALAEGKPLISGALSQWEGQISLFGVGADSPCYECVFPDAPAPDLAPSCAEVGVIGPLPGVIGSMMALEAIKLLAGAGETLSGRMMIYDALYADTRVIKLSKRAECKACAAAGR